jgi:hypothetical protein
VGRYNQLGRELCCKADIYSDVKRTGKCPEASTHADGFKEVRSRKGNNTEEAARTSKKAALSRASVEVLYVNDAPQTHGAYPAVFEDTCLHATDVQWTGYSICR